MEIVIESEPSGATVLRRGQPLGVTPLKVYVPSKTEKDTQRRSFKVERVGYKSATVNVYSSRNPYTLGNLVFTSTTSGAPSFLTDSYTEYAHVFSDESVVVELKRLPTEEELEREAALEAQREAGERAQKEDRLKELQALKDEKKRAMELMRKEREELAKAEQKRLAEENERLKAEREARDQEELARSEAKAKAEAEAKAKAEAEAKAKEEAEAKAKAEAEAKAKAEAEAKAKAEAEAKTKAEAEARAEAEAKAKAEAEKQGALEAGFDRLVEASSQLAAEREAFEKEKAKLLEERARLEQARQALEERSAQQAQEERDREAAHGAARAQGSTQSSSTKPAVDTGRRGETIDEKEERLLKKLREHQERLIKRDRSKRQLLKSPKSLPDFELSPAQESSLMSPSWGALALSVNHFGRLTRELALLELSAEEHSPTLRALFLRLSLAEGWIEEQSWERYLLFKHLAMSARAQLLTQPHGLALYRQLKALALSSQICHSPSLFAGERQP